MQVQEKRKHQDQISILNGNNQIKINEYLQNKHGANQTGSVVLTGEQPITQYVQQTSRQTQDLPNQQFEDLKGIIRGWQNAYQDMVIRNKQWEAAYIQLQAWKEEDGEYANELHQQLSYLQYNSKR